jgi:hypothetical protein
MQAASRVGGSHARSGMARAHLITASPLTARILPASVAPSIFRNKNRRRTGKYQSKQQGCRAQRTPHHEPMRTPHAAARRVPQKAAT